VKDLKKWDVSYKKGLASLSDEEYREIIQNPKMFSILGGNELKSTLDTWFAADSAPRKLKILGKSEGEDNI
jgi:hypothetical protein